MRKGFTLIELLVVIVIIGILVAIALPNFIRIKDKAKEAEVKQNVHAIQLAVERYAVDSPTAEYPYVVYGGDWTDTYTVSQGWANLQALDPTDKKFIPNDIKRQNWKEAKMPLGSDPLIEEAYLPNAPGNPFIKRKTTSISARIDHMPYLGAGPTFRYVGGKESNKMAEVFGPEFYHYPSQNIVGCWVVHHIYNNPAYSVTDLQKVPPGGYKNPSGNKVLTGNFSYFVRFGKDNFGAPGIFRATSQVQGYSLAGYGGPRTTGSDVYNRNGNYKGRYRTETCLVECGGFNPGSGYFPDVPCICGQNTPPTIARNDGGSDTVPDGVVIVLDSGLDKKGAAGQAGITEGS